MPTKNKRNHYNVKFLKGYGHSISVKNSKIIFKDNHVYHESGNFLLTYLLVYKINQS